MNDKNMDNEILKVIEELAKAQLETLKTLEKILDILI